MTLVANCEVGKDIAFEDIVKEHDAIFIPKLANLDSQSLVSLIRTLKYFFPFDLNLNISLFPIKQFLILADSMSLIIIGGRQVKKVFLMIKYSSEITKYNIWIL